MVTLYTPRARKIDAYADGGCIRVNPSRLGGTWAFVLVDGWTGEEVGSASGVVTPEQVGLPVVTNNYTELLACVEALQCVASMSPGWAGTLYTDSDVTHKRLVHARAKMNGVPDALRSRLGEVRALLGAFDVVLLGGHPTVAELVAGCRENGTPVSKWNCLVDKMCSIESEKFLRKLHANKISQQDVFGGTGSLHKRIERTSMLER